MAKYRLMKGGTQSVDCELLTESVNCYIVRFQNGVVRDVPKDSLYSFDEVDKKVIETVRMRNNEKTDMKQYRSNRPKYNSRMDESWDDVVDFGRKVVKKTKEVAGKVRDFFVNVFKSGNFLFFTSNGETLSASHPVNVIAGAKNTDCVNFIPGESVIEMCEENNIEPEAIENFQFAPCPYSGASIRLDEYSGVNESLSDDAKQFMSLVEDANSRLPKGPSRIDLISPDGLKDWNATQIRNRLYNMYIARYKGNYNKSVPLLIWGAPGIGKTSIIRSLKDLCVEKGLEEISIISINGGSVGPDDFTFPAQVTDDISNIKPTKFAKDIKRNDDINRDDTTIKSEVTKIADLPKNWLPVYNPDADNDEEQNKIANGGKYNKETGVLEDGPGGLFFIDEYSRMSDAGVAALMQTPVTRDIGGNSTLTLGNRWVIVCAANRKTDMSGSGVSEAMLIEAAVKTRFHHVNFVPTVQEWVAWANKKNDKRYDGKFNNVIPEIVNYILEDTDNGNKVNDFYEMWSHPDGEINGHMATACPRTWEALSDALIEEYLSDDALEHVGSLNEVSPQDMLNLGSGIIGENVMERFVNYISRMTTFSAEDAKNVWTKGDNANYEVLKIKDLSNYNRKYFVDTIIPILEQNITWKGIMPSENALNAVKFFKLASYNAGAKSFNLNAFKNYCKEFERYFKVNISNQSPSNPYNDVCTYFLDVCDNADRI